MLKEVLEALLRMGERAHTAEKAAAGKRFLSLGDVLKEAHVEVHSVTPAAPPPDEPDSEVDDPESVVEREGPLAWYHVELTLRPQAAEATWEPVGLILAGPDSESGPAGNAADAGRDWGEIYEVLAWTGQDWEDAGLAEYTGEQRLRLHLGVPAGVEKVRFRYHFEVFGEVTLPSGTEHPQ